MILPRPGRHNRASLAPRGPGLRQVAMTDALVLGQLAGQHAARSRYEARTSLSFTTLDGRLTERGIPH